MKKAAVVVAIALAISAGAYAWMKKTPQGAVYRTAKVEKGVIIDAITATGNINAVTTVSVGSQISGTIQQIFVDFNSRVRKGQVIAQVDPRLLESALVQARAAVENAKATLERAQVGVIDTERTYRRNQELVRSGFVAQADVDSSQTAYEQALAQKRSAEAALRQAEASRNTAQTNLEYATIRSPVDGIVISRNVDVGQTVAASFQTPTLFSIAQDLTKMQIDTNVDESDIGRAVPGQTATFTVDAYPEKMFTGRVEQVRNSPIVTQNVVTYDVVVRVDNRDLSLKPGMTANVTIEVRRYDDVLKIPNAALRYRPAGAVEKADGRKREREKEPAGQKVYTLGKDGKPSPVAIRTGISNGTFTQMLDGPLKDGDALVTGETGQKRNGGGSPPGMGFGGIR
ncbi:MAG: efflux RND transporter periplasmic adaptor subunit [Deltaproteobacteria bacterium]|nr:MAG: efflux RND transporter periplasmic adaptor subunit [Deltaproteobacteria bacterium]